MRALLALAAITLLSPAPCGAQTTTSEYQEYPVTGPETWSLKGRSYVIEGTGLLDGKVFIVRAIVDHMPSQSDKSDALNIAQFAVVQGYRTNSQRFRFLDQFAQVDMEHVGVALIYKKTDTSTSGFRFMFTTKEVLGSEYVEGRVDLPPYYSKEPATLEIAKDFWTKLANLKFEDLYNLMGADFRSSVTFYTFKIQSQKLSDGLKNCQLQSFSHFIFIGNTRAGPTYNLYYWVQNTQDNILGLLTIEVGDRPPRPNIVGYNVELSSFYKR